MLSQYVATVYLDELLDHGGFGDLLKEHVAEASDFLGKLETVASGGMVVDPDVLRTLVSSRRSGSVISPTGNATCWKRWHTEP